MSTAPAQPLSSAFGLPRVLSPVGALPQAADRLDPDPALRPEEIRIRVATLNIDSASFRQIAEDTGGDPEAIAARIREIVAVRGKMQNPVTGSGGMLLGTVEAVGEAYAAEPGVVVGARIATLVSLTLTPLHIERILAVRPDADQVDIDGHAVLWSGAPLVALPADLPEPLALSALDVCGAPAQVLRMVQPGQRVAVLGAGKSGALSLAAARRALGESGRLVAADLRPGVLPALADAGLVDAWATCDATRPVDTLHTLRELLGGEADLVVNTANVPGTELSSILPVRDGGTVYFFNMATSFSRATLGAEGLGRDAQLLMGNGYAPGHAALALELLRADPALRTAFRQLAGLPAGD